MANIPHSTTRASGLPASVDPFLLEKRLIESRESTLAVHHILSDIVTQGARMAYVKFIQTQCIPYIARTLTDELITVAKWAYLPLEPPRIDSECDEDLALPIIDEWAVGVIPIRDTKARVLRNSVIEPREVKVVARRPITREAPQEPEVKPETRESGRRTPRVSQREETKPKAKPPPSEYQVITRLFDAAKKKMQTGMGGKPFTVDAEMTVIQIQETKGLPPSFVVPKVAVKGRIPSQKSRADSVVVGTKKGARVEKRAASRRAGVRLLEPDVPVHDTEVTEVSYSDKFVPEPGVTMRDGGVVKSRQPLSGSGQISRAAFEAQLETLRRGEV